MQPDQILQQFVRETLTEALTAAELPVRDMALITNYRNLSHDWQVTLPLSVATSLAEAVVLVDAAFCNDVEIAAASRTVIGYTFKLQVTIGLMTPKSGAA